MLFKMADENNDGQISQKEAIDAGNLLVGGFFFRADTNGDGVLSKDEVRQARDSFLARQPADADPRPEEPGRRRRRRPGSPAANAEQMFERCVDTNHDGNLQASEVRQIVQTGVQGLFASADTNRDGQLSPTEVNAALIGMANAAAQAAFQTPPTPTTTARSARPSSTRRSSSPPTRSSAAWTPTTTARSRRRRPSRPARSVLNQVRRLRVPEPANSARNLLHSGRQPVPGRPDPDLPAAGPAGLGDPGGRPRPSRAELGSRSDRGNDGPPGDRSGGPFGRERRVGRLRAGCRSFGHPLEARVGTTGVLANVSARSRASCTLGFARRRMGRTWTRDPGRSLRPTGPRPGWRPARSSARARPRPARRRRRPSRPPRRRRRPCTHTDSGRRTSTPRPRPARSRSGRSSGRSAGRAEGRRRGPRSAPRCRPARRSSGTAARSCNRSAASTPPGNLRAATSDRSTPVGPNRAVAWIDSGSAPAKSRAVLTPYVPTSQSAPPPRAGSSRQSFMSIGNENDERISRSVADGPVGDPAADLGHRGAGAAT